MADGDSESGKSGSGKGSELEKSEGGDSPLESSRGETKIADTVVTKVAGIAAREVPGVYALGGGASRAFGAMTNAVGFGDERSQGVAVEVGEKEAAVDLTVVVEYGESIPEVANAIRENVIKRIEGIIGLKATEVNVAVNDLHFPGDDQPDPESQPAPQRVE